MTSIVGYHKGKPCSLYIYKQSYLKAYKYSTSIHINVLAAKISEGNFQIRVGARRKMYEKEH